MRKALIVGIDHYEKGSRLYGCVNDAMGVRSVLGYHADEEENKNFDCLTLTSTEDKGVSARVIRENLKELFLTDVQLDIALFYFAGHGSIGVTDGYLMASDTEVKEEGISMDYIVSLASQSRASHKVVLLDSCYSGMLGAAPEEEEARLCSGLTILTASTEKQYATEENGQGVFTQLLIDALQGAAASITGEISPGSVYAHIDQSLGGWEQRPVFKTNVKAFTSLRNVKAPIQLKDLRRIPEFFKHPDDVYSLDPSYEPRDEGRTEEMPAADPDNNEKFAILQRYNRLNLLVPHGAPHMWHAAMESKACKLTALGKHYHRLMSNGR